jgi:hypothetical protein
VNSPHVIHETINGEVIVINSAAGYHYSVKGAGADVWDAIQSAPGIDTSTITAAVVSRFDRASEAVEHETAAFLEQLRAGSRRRRRQRRRARGGCHRLAASEARRRTTVTDTSTVASAELGFGELEPLAESFSAAVRAASGIEERDFRLAGAAPRLRSPHPEKLRRLRRAFAHLELAESAASPDLAANRWDAATGAPPPPLPNTRAKRRPGHSSISATSSRARASSWARAATT